jgi:hypothetical protein
MRHQKEQPTLFEPTACDEFEPPRGLSSDDVSPAVTAKSDLPTSQGNVSSIELGMFRAVSPWAGMPLHEVCAACGREISGSGLVILDYEELGAFCDQDCGDKRFRWSLQEESEE